MNYHSFVSQPAFFSFLLEIDRSIAAEHHLLPCQECGGKLDRADFARSGYGVPDGVNEGSLTRFSFCCRREGCRKRSTPESLRFMRGMAYPSIVIVLFTAIHQGLTDARSKELATFLKVSRQTVARWMRWWRERFALTPFWRMHKARYIPPLDEAKLPYELVEAFQGTSTQIQDGLVKLLRFIAPFPRCSSRINQGHLPGGYFTQRMDVESSDPRC